MGVSARISEIFLYKESGKGIFIRPSKMGRIMSCPPSVRLSERLSVRPLTSGVCSITLIPFKIFS